MNMAMIIAVMNVSKAAAKRKPEKKFATASEFTASVALIIATIIDTFMGRLFAVFP